MGGPAVLSRLNLESPARQGSRSRATGSSNISVHPGSSWQIVTTFAVPYQDANNSRMGWP
ncbi:hypothetical protein RISK_005426 [Rhodopirellula islandica]|uniref:Uncharacterized protein n=1 Tax=Rhodopirellula islandica TaxID=595434 RepID=A0A0J1B6B5_RHOIS|nr:hypothetical protein RISK_005426 [Rhodopirellula islandica]